MGIIIKADEDIAPRVLEPLAVAGHDIRTVVGQGWAGMPDIELFARVIAEEAMFVTADRGFGDIRAYPPGTHHGIIVLRPARESIVEYRELIERVLLHHRLEDLVGCLIVVTPTNVRVRRRA